MFNKHKSNPTFRLEPRLVLVLIFLLATAAAAWRFWPWMPKVFFGDDLANILAYKGGAFASSLSQALVAAYADKYRPVFASAMWLLFSSFGSAIQPYMMVNILLQGLSATLVFSIAQRLSRGNCLASLAVTLAVATSRFALYQVTQVTGLLEGIALACFLAMVYCVVRASENRESAWRWSWLAVASAFLAIQTHERYIVVAIWLCLALALLPRVRMLPRSRWLTLLGASIAIPVFNIAYKKAVLHQPFFIGTGGTDISINTSRVLGQLVQAILSIFGFNDGPDYLIGTGMASLGWFPAWLLVAALVLVWLIVVISGLRAAFDKRDRAAEPVWQALAWPVLLLVLAALLLGPPLLTIRLEQRWLYEPFILMLFLFAWGIGAKHHWSTVPAWILAIIVATASIGIDSIIAPHFKQIFFVSSGRLATVVKRDILDTKRLEATPVVLLADPGTCNWTLSNGAFTHLYGDEGHKLYCFGSTDESLSATLPAGVRVFGVSASPLHLIDVTNQWDTLARAHKRKATFDVLAAFSAGHINNPAKVDTPTGRGVLAMPWDTVLGPQKTLTVLSGFSYRYDAVPVGPNAQLTFGVSMIYPSPDSARAIVSISVGGGLPKVLYSRDLTPPVKGEKLQFESVTIPLTQFSGQQVSLTFAVETPGPDSNGHWVGFAYPRIIVADQH